MELLARESAAHRCPYCHDMLDADPVLVTCEGCGTSHHAACSAELGRCSILGCDASLPPGPHDDRDPEEGAQRAEIRRRYRSRVQRFVQTHARGPWDFEGPRERLREALEALVAATKAGDLRATRAARRDVRVLEASLCRDEVRAAYAELQVEPELRVELRTETPVERAQRELVKRLVIIVNVGLLLILLALAVVAGNA